MLLFKKENSTYLKAPMQFDVIWFCGVKEMKGA